MTTTPTPTPRPRHVKVDRLSKPVSQTDYLQMLDEAMRFARIEESKPMLNAKELPIQTKREVK
jgi:hypothetical protein